MSQTMRDRLIAKADEILKGPGPTAAMLVDALLGELRFPDTAMESAGWATDTSKPDQLSARMEETGPSDTFTAMIDAVRNETASLS